MLHVTDQVSCWTLNNNTKQRWRLYQGRSQEFDLRNWEGVNFGGLNLGGYKLLMLMSHFMIIKGLADFGRVTIYTDIPPSLRPCRLYTHTHTHTHMTRQPACNPAWSIKQKFSTAAGGERPCSETCATVVLSLSHLLTLKLSHFRMRATKLPWRYISSR